MECVLYNYVANNYTVPTDKETVRKRADAIDSTSTHGAVGAKEQYHLSLLNVLAILIGHMKFTSHETRLETLRWLLWLHKKLPRRVGNCYGYNDFCLTASALSDISSGWQTFTPAPGNVDGYFRQGIHFR